MKILVLCKKFPFPLKDGESIAVSHLCKELKAKGCDITLLCLNTTKHYFNPADLPETFNYFSSIHTVDLDNSIKPWSAFASMMSGDSYHVRRFKSGIFRAKLIEILQAEKFDIIQLETLYLAPYVNTIRKYSQARIVMRAHNVEHEIWERITRNSSSQLKKLYLGYLTRKLKEYEIGQFPVYDYLVTLTERDLTLFREKGYTNGASAAPIGLSDAGYTYRKPDFGKKMSLCFIGSLDWMPNLEGLEWFLEQCWPAIHKRWPHLTFHVAGRNTPPTLLHLKQRGVVIHGEVEDASAFLQQHSMMIVPLFSGSGMRVKIVEGMLMGKVVITTSLGHEGIESTHRTHVLIANKASEFIDAIQYCVDHPDKAIQMGMEAKAFARQKFDSAEVADMMMDIYTQLLKTASHHPTAVQGSLPN